MRVVTMHRGAGWKVSLYGREHGAPHFHIEGPGYRCSIGIQSLEIVIGAAPASVLRAARAWADENRDALQDQ